MMIGEKNVLRQLRVTFTRTVESVLERYSPGREFALNTLIMMMGTSLAQGITIAVAPILTRLYTPEDFGVFTLYLSIVTMVTVISTGRYDLAVMLPDNDKDAVNLMSLSLFLTLVTSCLTLVSVFWGRNVIAEMLGHPEIASWLFFVPPAILLTGTYQVIYAWSNRKKRFRALSLSRLSGTSVSSVTNVGMGIVYTGALGLITGYMVNQGIALSTLIWRFLQEDRLWLNKSTLVDMIKQARKYYRFPLFSLPADFANTASQQAPVLLLNAFFGVSVVGFFSLTQRIMALPANLIATSVLATFRQRATHDFNTYGSCRSIYVKTFKVLFAFSILPFLFVLFFAPEFFGWAFGIEWKVAGEYAQILAPLFLLRFFSSPLSYVLYVAEKQNYDLIGQIVLLLLSIVSISTGGYLGQPKVSLILFSISYSIVYVYYLVLSYRFSINYAVKGGSNEH